MLDFNNLDFSNICENWFLNFNDFLKDDKFNYDNLFYSESHWRDFVSITGDIITFTGIKNFNEILRNNIIKQNARNFCVDTSRTPPREVVRAGEKVIEAIFSFKTKEGIGEGVLRLMPSKKNPTHFKCWSISTSLKELNLKKVSSKASTIRDFKAPNWLDIRNFEKSYIDREPTVLVVGCGQAGLSIASRLKQLNIDTLIIDKHERIGDNWRKRYHSLTLHNQTQVNHLPLMPFPKTWPTYIAKDKLAGWFEYYAESLELNVWNNTEFISAEYLSKDKIWDVKIKDTKGKIKKIKPQHIVMAIGVSSVPKMPNIKGIENFKGEKIHSGYFKSGKPYQNKNVLVFGTGTSSHDVCQDLHANGANVTMVQRSPTMIVNLEPSAQLPYALYQEGPSTDDCDLIAISSPLSVLKKTHQILTKQSKKLDSELLKKLEKIGFVLDYGEDNTGWQFKYLTRGGGYYFNVGASNLVADQKIKLIQFSDIKEFLSDGIIHNSKKLEYDSFVFATGYKGQEYMVKKFFGNEVANKVGRIWNFNSKKQELNNMFVKTNQQGLWFIAGSLAQCRIFSKYLSFQISKEIK